MTCSGSGASGSASVGVEGYRNMEGIAADGYISGSEICIDEDDDWVCDDNETSTTSDNNGAFLIKYSNGNLLSIGGTDFDTQIQLDNFLISHTLNGYTDFKVITPVTSVATFMDSPSNINTVLGIDSSIDISIFDPVANKGDSGINDYLFEKGNQLTVLAFALQNITNNLNNSTDTTEDYFLAISQVLETEYAETSSKVDIETESFITKVLDNLISAKSITIADDAKSNTLKSIAGVMPIIQVKSDNNLTNEIIKFGISTMQSDVTSIANGTASADIVNSYTADIFNYIATTQNVTASDLIPDISTIIDNISTDEDVSVEFNALSNDSFVTTAPYSVSYTNPSNGSVSISGDLVTYNPNADFNGSDSFSYTLTQSDKVSSSTINLTINPVNDDPVINTASTISVEENQTAVATIDTSDVDTEDTLTLSLSGTDQDSFDLSSDDVLTFKTAPDYETKTSYLITLSLTDGTATVTKDLTINILNLNDVAPEFTSAATFSIDENTTAVGTAAATDVEGDDVTFTISGSELSITSAGVITFNSAPDYETKTSHTATITASDGVNTTDQSITVNINNLNDNNPVFTTSSTLNGDENQTSISTVAASDADGDSVSFTISGSDLAISSDGVLTFVTEPDYEQVTSFTATITATDGTLSTDQSVTVNVNNLNDNAPVYTAATGVNASENQTSAFTVTGTDADGDTLAYAISGGADKDSFTINSSSGVVTFNTAPDYETKTTYVIVVDILDGGYTTSQEVTINITDVNEAPLISSSASFNADENQTAIGTASASDPEGTEISYSVTGTDAGVISISSSGVLSFDTAPNYESKNAYSVTLNAGDGVNTTSQNISIAINDINDAPVASSDNYVMKLLPQAQSSTTITLQGTDEDGDSLTYSIVSNGTHGTASLSGATITYTTLAATQSALTDSFTFKVNDGTVDSANNATISIDTVTDPLYQYQWHLNNTGQTNFATNAGTAGEDLNVDTAIVDGITGDGVVVAVVDEGLELAHEDLIDNIVSGSYDFANSDTDPTRSANDGDHGTSVAGIIASKGWNNKGGRGVAPNASLIGYNLLESGANPSYAQIWGTSPPVSVDVDIYNNSFGLNYGGASTYTVQTYLSGTTLDVLENGVANLRGGKGAIYVYSAGNAFGSNATNDCGTDLTCTEGIIDNTKNQIYTIPVAALNANGTKTSYSTSGANIWISGFGGEDGWNNAILNSQNIGNQSATATSPAIMTTDQSTCSKGYVSSNGSTGGVAGLEPNEFDQFDGGYSENSNCNYTSIFNGTSSAAPTVAGVIALMLEANPNLTWRDVKHILATTADKVDTSKSFDQQGINQYSWIQNDAGFEHHKWYGFGKIDAAEAVSTSKTYTANSRGTLSTVSGSSGTINTNINNNGTTTSNTVAITKTNGSNNFVEYVKVQVLFTHNVPRSLGIRLQSPDGTIIPILQPYTNISANSSGVLFDIGVAGFYGESVEGDWIIGLNDYINDGTDGTFVGWNIYVSGN